MKKMLFIIALCSANSSFAQSSKYTLQQCIAYTMAHNISIQQSEINSNIAQVQTEQYKYNQYPTVNSSISNGFSFGRSVDPTSNQFITQGYYYNGVNLGTSALLFGWFQKKYQVQQSQLDFEATKLQYKQLQNDIGLNIAMGYLKILLAKEQIKVNANQLATDIQQYTTTQKRVDAGALPELNVAQMKAQLAVDSSNISNARIEEKQSLLDLKALLNMDMSQELDVEIPNLDLSQQSTLYEYPTAQMVYTTALGLQNKMQYNNLKVQSANKQIQIAKTTGKPQLSINASLGTNYASTVKEVTGATLVGNQTIANVTVGGVEYPIQQPTYTYNFKNIPLFKQYKNNLRETVSLDLQIPIFNGYSNKINVQKATLNLQNQKLLQQQDINKLQQDVYKAHNDAENSYQKYIAAKRTEETNAYATQLAIKRYEIGMLSTLEYATQMNNLTKAQSNTLSAKYDFIFKLKILDYYLGKEIIL